MDRDVKFIMREEISSKNYIIKTLLENISQINNSFYKHSYNQNNRLKVNAEIRDGFVFLKSKKNRFQYCQSLSKLNENVLSPNIFQQLTVEDDVKESANEEQNGNNSNNNPTRTTSKESYVKLADLNLNNCNRPSKIANR